jgi:transcriptional repressor NrdR
MKCPECDQPTIHILESRHGDDHVRRRRECKSCGARFTTYEYVDQGSVKRTQKKLQTVQ